MNADTHTQIPSQLPAGPFENIEVITNSSSKHSTVGTTGFINIRLKEDHGHSYFEKCCN